MDDTEKSYLEIKVTFHHILILLVGVILIGSFLFYLGYQAGKTSTKDLEQELLQAKEEVKTRKIEEIPATSIAKELQSHEQSTNEGNETSAGSGEMVPPKTTGTETPASDTTVPSPVLETKTTKPKPEEKSETIKTAKPVKKNQSFSIQVGAFNSHALAKDYSVKFSRAGYAISISQAEVKGKTWYRVRIGNFKTREEAQKEKTKLEKLENQKFSIVKSE